MPSETGFSVVNLAILLVVALVVVPGYLRLRRVVSVQRRQRWAEEDAAYRAAVESRDTIIDGDGAA
jgi:hypothetical protein